MAILGDVMLSVRNKTFMLSVIILSVIMHSIIMQCHYAECHCDEYRRACE
jgi:hypothetical protein